MWEEDGPENSRPGWDYRADIDEVHSALKRLNQGYYDCVARNGPLPLGSCELDELQRLLRLADEIKCLAWMLHHYIQMEINAERSGPFAGDAGEGR